MFQLSAAMIADLLSKHHQELQRFLTRRVGCPDMAEDIFQTLFLRLAGYQSGEKIDNPRAFLFRTAANLATDHLRSQERRDNLYTADARYEDFADAAPTPETIALSRQQLDILKQAVAELPPKCREVFILCKFEQYTYPQAAKMLGITESAVTKHMIKALDYCKRRVYEDY